MKWWNPMTTGRKYNDHMIKSIFSNSTNILNTSQKILRSLCPNNQTLRVLCLFSEVASRFSSSGVPSHDSSACALTCHFQTLTGKSSFYFLTYPEGPNSIPASPLWYVITQKLTHDTHYLWPLTLIFPYSSSFKLFESILKDRCWFLIQISPSITQPRVGTQVHPTQSDSVNCVNKSNFVNDKCYGFYVLRTVLWIVLLWYSNKRHALINILKHPEIYTVF